MRKNTAEIEKFNALAADWWSPKGPMAPLHWMNPPRLDFIANHLPKGTGRGLDVGCGAGLLTEPLSRMGHTMTGVDGAADAIMVARRRADNEGLAVDYQVGEVGADAQLQGPYDFITALEIIEHVEDPEAFLDALLPNLKSGGMIFVSTLNRTMKARLLAVWMAEYVLRALPVGTHDWNKFIKPHELVHMLEKRSCKLVGLSGMVFKPRTRSFTLDAYDMDVNYILAARKR